MQRIRASVFPLYATCVGVALGAALTGCASSRLSSELPPGVHLAGDWKLDPSSSDDLGKAIQELGQQGRKARHEKREQQASGSTGETEGPGSGRGHRHAGPGQPGGGQQTGDAGEGDTGSGPQGGGPGMGMGPMPHLSPVDELMSNVPQGDYLRISVSADAFTVTSGDSSNQYTPGLEADISAEQGDAQQISGWKDNAYVIDTKPQFGAEIIQSYGLTKDGKLIMTLRLSGNGIKFTFNRVYDRTTRVTPLAPPTLN